MARLIERTQGETREVSLAVVTSIGRDAGNTLRLQDDKISRRHCVIEFKSEGYVLRDLQSLAGTYVNNESVKGEVVLKDGDEIRCGNFRARFEDDPEPRKRAPVAPAPPELVPMDTPPPIAIGTRKNLLDPTDVAPPTMETVPRYGDELATPAPAAVPKVDAVDAPELYGPPTEQGEFPPFVNNTDAQADYELLRRFYGLMKKLGSTGASLTILSDVLHDARAAVSADSLGLFLRTAPDAFDAKARTVVFRPGASSPTLLEPIAREAMTRGPVLANDVRTLVPDSTAVASVMAFPLHQASTVRGVVWFEASTLHRYRPRQVEAMATFASVLGVYLASVPGFYG